ncbi:MAG: FKBP-type peptidyl-prolyl cis-trans isomerase [Ardenticatenales bacterium]
MNRTLLAALACAALLPLSAIACGPTTEAPAGDPAAVNAPAGDAAAVNAPADDAGAAQGGAADAGQAAPPAMPVSQLCASTPTMPDVTSGDFTEMAGGMKMKDLVVGTGAEVAVGMSTAVNYAGFFEDGSSFDSSCKPGGQPLATNLTGGLIDGWLQGIPGMKVGGRRILVIPPALAYGESGRPGIPPNATLIFDIEAMASQ